jgi:hypothetical protein
MKKRTGWKPIPREAVYFPLSADCFLKASAYLGIPDWELRARRKPSSRLRATGVPLNRSADRQYAAT